MEDVILKMCRARLNRLYASRNSGTTDGLDEYLSYRILAAIQELETAGIRPDGSPGDNILVADYVCWSYANRDKGEGMPEWLRLRRWERHMAEGTT